MAIEKRIFNVLWPMISSIAESSCNARRLRLRSCEAGRSPSKTSAENVTCEEAFGCKVAEALVDMNLEEAPNECEENGLNTGSGVTLEFVSARSSDALSFSSISPRFDVYQSSNKEPEIVIHSICSLKVLSNLSDKPKPKLS